MLTRRFFIGGAASCLALGPNRIFAAAAGAVAPDRPALTFGVISDVHIALAKGGKGFSQRYTTETLKATLARFRDAGVDAVVIAGDMAHHALGPELVAVGDAWREIFPGGCAPDGRKVERVFVTGNHDNGPSRAKKVLADAKALKEALEGKTVVVDARVGEEGQLFGSVTTTQIAEAVAAQLGVEIDRKRIERTTAIKMAGIHNVTVGLYRDINATLSVSVGVAAEEPAEAAEVVEEAAEEVAEVTEATEETTEA
jgi:large subunit ribosomal protein L9